MKPSTSIFLALLLFTNLHTFAQHKKILLIGMDGCRADALQIARTPILDNIIETGYSCMNARTVVPTMSGPGWASMLTGVWYNKHQVHGNLFIGNELDEFVHFFNHIEAQNPELETVSISHWGPINNKIIRKVDHKSSPKSDLTVAHEAIDYLTNKNPDALFLHFDDIDHAGHFSGFSPTNKKYLAEIEKVDSLIGLVLTALKARPTFEQEDWLILFSPDHGGINNSHGGGTEVERNTFIIAHQKDIKPQKARPQKIEFPASQTLEFSKAQQHFILAPFPKCTAKAWTFSLSFRIKKWKADAYLVHSSNLIIKTHPKDQHTWFAWVGNKKIKIQGDTIRNKQWHTIDISCTKEGLVKVFQNGRIVGLEQSKSSIESIFKDSIVIHYHTNNQQNSLHWELYNCRLLPLVGLNNYRNTWIGSKDVADLEPNVLYSWQHSQKHNNVRIKAPKHHYKKPLTFYDYSHYPTMVDIAPTLLKHLNIKIRPEQKETFFDGKPLVIE